MHFTHTMRIGLVLTGTCVLCTATGKPAFSQNLLYTLNGVTFSDGATATGYFDFNPTTSAFGSYDITTTDGVTDTLTGANLTPSSSYPNLDTYVEFVSNNIPFHQLLLDTSSIAITPGTYSLIPGKSHAPNALSGSGEFTPTVRTVITGSLVVNNPAAVPEASTTISFGLLLTLGLGGAIIATRKKKATA